MKSLPVVAGLVAVAALVGVSGIPATPADAQTRMSAPAAQPMAQKPMMQKAMPSAQVKALQSALNSKAGAKLKVDGLLGARTKAALKKYQSANGLMSTGENDAATRAKLGI
ncbi:MAG TPA: peptidoglycan-binding domain-containing protein [Alphaproteobacteria bacterium]